MNRVDIVYTSLDRRPAIRPAPAGEVAEVLDALWAHTTPDDGLEHVSGNAEPDRINLLLFLLPPDTDHAAADAAHRAARLLARCHQASPLLQHRYLTPPPVADHDPDNSHGQDNGHGQDRDQGQVQDS